MTVSDFRLSTFDLGRGDGRRKGAGPARRGFTVLELLVASLLLSMLVTILTMIFNQSSIAWRTGVASVNDLQDTREQMGGCHDVTDDALPGVGQSGAVRTGNQDNRRIEYRTVSIFRNWGGSKNNFSPSRSFSGRLIDSINWNGLSSFSVSDAMSGRSKNLSKGSYAQSEGGYVVGVRSSGPNGIMDDDDDINTFPEDIQ